MKETSILDQLKEKKKKPEDMVETVIEDPKLLPEILEGFLAKPANVKFPSAKLLSLISKEKPELLYPHFDFFVEQLDNENNVLKWNAMDILANLTRVDSEKKFDKLFDRYFGLIDEGSLITTGHVVTNSAIVAKAKPYFENKITADLLRIQEYPLPTDECRNILKGHAIKAFDSYFDEINNKDDVIAFVKKELKNTRSGTAKKAQKFLNKKRAPQDN